MIKETEHPIPPQPFDFRDAGVNPKTIAPRQFFTCGNPPVPHAPKVRNETAQGKQSAALGSAVPESNKAL